MCECILKDKYKLRFRKALKQYLIHYYLQKKLNRKTTYYKVSIMNGLLDQNDKFTRKGLKYIECCKNTN